MAEAMMSSLMLSVFGLALSSILVYLSLPRLMSRLTRERIVGRDMLKREETYAPESGGIAIVMALVISLTIVSYLFVTYAYKPQSGEPARTEMYVWMLSAIATILSVGFIGLVDDYLKIPQRYKIIFPAFAALPLAFGFIGRVDFWVPFIGYVRLGVLYPLLLIPLGITAASNLTNMYAGLNGLESGTGMIVCGFTALAAGLVGRWEAVIVLAPMMGALAAFLAYNSYPSRVFPGDVGTLSIGACLAIASMVGRIKIIAVIALAPHIVNFLMYVIKIRFFAAHPEAKFASVRKDGTLAPPEGAEYGSLYFMIMHLFRKGEKWHVRFHWALCAVSGSAAIIVGILIPAYGISVF